MKNKKRIKSNIQVLFMVFFALLLNACSDKSLKETGDTNDSINIELAETLKSSETTEMAVESPPFTDGIFPCNDCHSEIEPNQ